MQYTLIVGPGYLGQRMQQLLSVPAFLLLDKVASIAEVSAIMARHDIGCVINAAGKTGRPNIDWCESHVAETRLANIMLPVALAVACKDRGVPLIHLSSGCLFDGDNGGRGWSETDMPNNLTNVYTRSKAEAERRLIELDGHVIILRLRMPFDVVPHPRNLFTKLCGYADIVTVENSLTSVPFLAEVVEAAIRRPAGFPRGIYHVVCRGRITHREVLAECRAVGLEPAVERYITPEQLSGLVVAKRSNCILSVKKLEEQIGHVPEVKDEVRRCLKTMEGRLK